LKAINEWDELDDEQAFLDKYGFKPSRQYVLVHGGKRYASKAIVGAAHGYDRPDLGPLTASDFSGGVASSGAASLLETNGFTVESAATNFSLGSWVFKVNPEHFDLARALAVLPTLQWVARQSFKQIRPGDTVRLWQSGREAGVLARGRILTEPAEEGIDPS